MATLCRPNTLLAHNEVNRSPSCSREVGASGSEVHLMRTSNVQLCTELTRSLLKFHRGTIFFNAGCYEASGGKR